MNLEITAKLLEQVKSNESVRSIFKKTVTTMYKAYRAGLIDSDEYMKEYDAVLYKCSLMIN